MIIVFNEYDGKELTRFSLVNGNEKDFLAGFDFCATQPALGRPIAPSIYRVLATKEPPQVGDRIQLTTDVDRSMNFTADKGLRGTIVEAREGMIRAKMDEFIPGCEEWDNEIIWGDGRDCDWEEIYWFWREAEIIYD